MQKFKRICPKCKSNNTKKDWKRRGKQIYFELSKDSWLSIKTIVSDWRRWLLDRFHWIPVKMCYFHQKAIVRRYLTKNPKLKPNQELKGFAILVCLSRLLLKT